MVIFVFHSTLTFSGSFHICCSVVHTPCSSDIITANISLRIEHLSVSHVGRGINCGLGKLKFKTCSLDDYSMVYLSNTVYVLISQDHDGGDLLVFLLRASISAMSMIFQSRWLIWLLFLSFLLLTCTVPEVYLVFVSTALLDVEAQVPLWDTSLKMCFGERNKKRGTNQNMG